MKTTPSIMMRLCSAGKTNCKILIFVQNSINIIPSIRCYSTKDSYHSSYSSLDWLAYEIGLSYHECGEFSELTADKVSEIKKSIKDGRYTLSPLLAETFTRAVDAKSSLVFTYLGDPDRYMVVRPTPEDHIVLQGVGFMLTRHFNRINYLMDNSFGLRTPMNDYYRSVCDKGKVLTLYKFDLIKSILTINREGLLWHLSNIVKDRAIIELVGKFLYLPIKNECGIDVTHEIGCAIPPTGVLTNVLLNLVLTELDKEFPREFPGLNYSRYINEVIVSFPCTDESNQGKLLESESELFEDNLLALFSYLKLVGEIHSIGPGDPPLLCYGGLVSVCQDGQIQLIESNIGKER